MTQIQGSQPFMLSGGDTLSEVARDHGISLDALLRANPEIQDPDHARAGTRLNIPSAGPVDSFESAPARTTRWDGGRVAAPAASPAQITGPKLREGAKGAQVRAVQERLAGLGYSVGSDGSYGRLTAAAVHQFQVANGLKSDGVVGAQTMAAMNSAAAKPAPQAGALNTQAARYAPNSPEAIALFEAAAEKVDLPTEWASSPALHELLRRESDGEVGRVNYSYDERATDPSRWSEVHSELKQGKITARSSATGLGQLILDNVETFYPSGSAGIGDPVEEAAGMLKYIESRYGTPQQALIEYGVHHEGY